MRNGRAPTLARFAVSGLVVVGMAVGGGLARAGPGKDGQVPAGTPVAASLQPDPAECVGPARTPDELRGLAPGGVRRSGVRPREVVGPALVAGVTAAIRLYVACVNTGDDLRRYGVATDDFVRMVPSGDGFLVDDAAELAYLATPVPIRWGYLYPMPTVLAVTALDDGRVATDIVFSRPEGQRRTTLVWARVDGRWLVDEERASVDQELRPRDVEDFQARRDGSVGRPGGASLPG